MYPFIAIIKMSTKMKQYLMDSGENLKKLATIRPMNPAIWFKKANIKVSLSVRTLRW